MNKNFALHFSSNPGWVIVSFYFIFFFFELATKQLMHLIQNRKVEFQREPGHCVVSLSEALCSHNVFCLAGV